MDPLDIFPFELSEQIFKLLDAADLLNASLVSKNWYNTIGASTVVMDKITLNIGCSCDDETIEIITKGPRQYRRIYIKENLIETCKLCATKCIPLMLKYQWKWVRIENMEFLTTAEATTFLKHFELSVETLFITNFFIDSHIVARDHHKFTFPKLVHLQLLTCSPLLVHELFENVKSLRRCVIHKCKFSIRAAQTCVKIVKNNQNLNHFALDFGWICEMFCNPSTMRGIKMNCDFNIFWDRHLDSDYALDRIFNYLRWVAESGYDLKQFSKFLV